MPGRREGSIAGPGDPCGTPSESDAPTLGTVVYRSLGEKLVKGHLEPNARLRIRELAAELGTSVTPVRDAVLRLVQDRALVMRSPRDIRVPVLSSRDFVEIRTIRIRLEELAVATAAVRVEPPDIEELRELVERSVAALEEGDVGLALEINQVFHFRLVELADMPNLGRMLQKLWLQMGPLIPQTDAVTPPRTALAHHAAAVDALARADGDGAARALREDITTGSVAILARILDHERQGIPPEPR